MELVKYSDLEGAIDGLRKRGFVYNFKLTPEGLKCLATKDVYHPSDLKIKEFHRFYAFEKGMESSLIFVVSSNDKVNGFVLSTYHNDVDLDLIKFMQRVKVYKPQRVIPSAN